MDSPTIKNLLRLEGGPAFALQDFIVSYASPEAAELGLTPGMDIRNLLESTVLPEIGAGVAESQVLLGGQRWTLRASAMIDLTLCYLRPPKTPEIAPNGSTLLHAAGSIRTTLQDLLVSLDAMADTLCDDPVATHQAALALRSVFQLRRIAGNLELLSALSTGSFRLSRQSCLPVSAAAVLFAELEELLRPVGLKLHWELPERDFRCCVDWPLTAALLRELIANAAADASDGTICLSMSKVGQDRLCFSVRNLPAAPLPEAPFHRHASEQSDLRGRAGLGLSLVSAGAERHGGGLLLSTDESGVVTALLTIQIADRADETVRSPVQLPQEADSNLVALSQLLPTECFRLEDLM